MLLLLQIMKRPFRYAAPLSQIAPHLPYLFFMVRSVSADTSTNIGVKWDPYLGSILRLFFKRILVTPKLLSI